MMAGPLLKLSKLCLFLLCSQNVSIVPNVKWLACKSLLVDTHLVHVFDLTKIFLAFLNECINGWMDGWMLVSPVGWASH